MTTNKKYEFTGETQVVAGRTLRRIRAVRAFGNVKAGDLGGWIEAERNLSHADTCWVHATAQVFGNAEVYGNARVYGNAYVCGSVGVCDNAQVYGNVLVCGNARVHGDAQVYGSAHVYGNAVVYGSARVYDNARVCGNARVYGSVAVFDNAHVYDNVEVYGNAQVSGSAQVCGNAEIRGSAICSISPIVVTGLRYRVTITDKHIQIGCQQYTASECKKKLPTLIKEYKLSKLEREYLELIIKTSRSQTGKTRIGEGKVRNPTKRTRK